MMLPLNWMSSACPLPSQNKPNRPLIIRLFRMLTALSVVALSE